MPVLHHSSYPGPPSLQFNGHLETMAPMLRRVDLAYERERLELPDGDFVDLDWVDRGSRKLVLLTHGLEGGADRPYMKGMARYFADRGWDALAWNCRSCSGEMNRRLRLYHHGEIGDIGEVIRHALRTKDYTHIAMIGFSMGGNITAKYLGVHGKEIPDPIRSAVVFSTPCDLEASILSIEKPLNRFYSQYFHKQLKAKIEAKAVQFPGQIDLRHFKTIRCWRDFDTHYSTVLTGCADADAFYHQASSKNFMGGTQVPILIVNALNDPMLAGECYPTALCEKHPKLFLEMPRKGGHVGFLLPNAKHAWSEWRAWEFVEERVV
ncbi:MAG: alpha/beta fold hydrolase [Saprospiraceae bacterium]|nr:alpha/beta fold hydrolase [Saprospiraceae bacterium]